MSELEQWGGRGLGPVAGAGSEATKVEQTRAGVEVIASMQAARAFPRDPAVVWREMEQACAGRALAARAFYAYRQGGANVEGPTVTLARELARIYRNVDYGTQELARNTVLRQSEVRAAARDLETNTYAHRTVIVPWSRYKGSGDLDKVWEIDQNNNSVAGRALREMILAVLPEEFVARAKELCAQTNDTGDADVSLDTRRQQAVTEFGKARPPITQAQLEEHLGRPLAQWSGADCARLETLFGSLKRREIAREDVFPVTTGAAAGFTAADAGVSAAAAAGPEVQDPGEYDPTIAPGWGASDETGGA